MSFLRALRFIWLFVTFVLCVTDLPDPFHKYIGLPWGTYAAQHYDANGDFYVIPNVRFGSQPVRFNISSFPPSSSYTPDLQSNLHNVMCLQIDTTATNCSAASSMALRAEPDLGQPFIGNPVGNVDESEDCLFVDLYIPSVAFSHGAPKLPVVVWFYGGAYLYGSKDKASPNLKASLPLYNGTGVMRAASTLGSPFIFLVGNYRVGALGWLAGQSMEAHAEQGLAVPNAGLYDQRLLLEFVQKYIGVVGGDNKRVSAWGESAGAGSVLHHLVANWTQNATQSDPLFSKIMIQSPAFEWQFDRSANGIIETAYQNLTILANCTGQGIKCLQDLDPKTMRTLNQRLYEETKCTGIFSVGPAVDGKLINELPVLSFARGARANTITSFIVSHVGDESSSFIPSYITANSGFQTFLNYFMPGSKYDSIRNKIMKQYNSGSDCESASLVIRDSVITCNTRNIYDAYHNDPNVNPYMMTYDFLESLKLSTHGSDLLPTFWNSDLNLTALLYELKNVSVPDFMINRVKNFSAEYQRYLVQHAVTGDPNNGLNSIHWPKAENGASLWNVFETRFSIFDSFFTTTTDLQNGYRTCMFWKQIAKDLLAVENAEMSGHLGWPGDDAELEEL